MWNLRVGRSLSLGARQTLELSLDIFNVVNAGTGTTFSATAHQQFSPEFGDLTNVQPPRSARVYAHLAF